MERISVNASGKYDVVIGRGLIGDSAGLISPLLGSGRLAVITDDNVKNFCLGALKASLENAGIPYEVFVIPHGESSKNMTTLGTALEFLASHAFTRSDMIAALGGGSSAIFPALRRDVICAVYGMCKSRPRCSPVSIPRSAANARSISRREKISPGRSGSHPS